MIFVTIGTSEPFDRLLHEVDRLETHEQLVVQLGASTVRPRSAECFGFLGFEETLDLMYRARVVLSHAGVGSVLAAHTTGKKPVVVPRLRRHGEAVDDHQVPFAERLDNLGLASYVRDLVDLGDTLANSESTITPQTTDGALVDDLRRHLRSEIVPHPPRPRE